MKQDKDASPVWLYVAIFVILLLVFFTSVPLMMREGAYLIKFWFGG